MTLYASFHAQIHSLYTLASIPINTSTTTTTKQKSPSLFLSHIFIHYPCEWRGIYGDPVMCNRNRGGGERWTQIDRLPNRRSSTKPAGSSRDSAAGSHHLLFVHTNQLIFINTLLISNFRENPKDSSINIFCTTKMVLAEYNFGLFLILWGRSTTILIKIRG